MSNVQTVRDIYEAFGSGDVPVILEKLSPDVEWEYPQTATSVPWLQRRVGREAAAGFFQALDSIEMEKFVPKDLLEGKGVVVALLDVTFRVKATGQRVVEEDEIHIWRFDDQGMVVRFKHGADTHQHELAWQDATR